MRFGITSRSGSKEAVDLAAQAINYLEPEHEVLVEPALGKKLGRDGIALDDMDVDVMIALGGDGTVLRALQHTNAPIFSVNVGSLGFLTEVSPDEMLYALERIVAGDYMIDERIKLKAMLNEKRLVDSTNEVVIHTSQIAKIRHFQIFIDDELVDSVRADGIIVATPTGSTCYAMSVGSPILFPGLSAFVIVPIAPFKLSARPMVISSDSVIEIKLYEPRKNCVVVMDGQENVRMTPKDSLKISLSENRARFIRFGQDFYRKIKEKFGI